jgi:hypothetical protein
VLSRSATEPYVASAVRCIVDNCDEKLVSVLGNVPNGRTKLSMLRRRSVQSLVAEAHNTVLLVSRSWTAKASDHACPTS